MLNQIGLDTEKTLLITEKLNVLLANFSIYYMNLRGLHWNITGEKFYELHLKFEEFYNDTQLKIDEIAERILSLGNNPSPCYSNYIETSEISEIKQCNNGKEAISHIISSISILLKLEREILSMSSDAGDEGTNSMMSDDIREQEKVIWMLNAYLK